jgi:hypothetical protein
MYPDKTNFFLPYFLFLTKWHYLCDCMLLSIIIYNISLIYEEFRKGQLYYNCGCNMRRQRRSCTCWLQQKQSQGQLWTKSFNRLSLLDLQVAGLRGYANTPARKVMVVRPEIEPRSPPLNIASIYQPPLQFLVRASACASGWRCTRWWRT